jgi:hypothetical protein
MQLRGLERQAPYNMLVDGTKLARNNSVHSH